jgi:hypothetical protein
MTRRFLVIAAVAFAWSCSSSRAPQPIPIPQQPAAQPATQPAPTTTAAPTRPAAQQPAPGGAAPAPAAPVDTNPESNPVVKNLLGTIAGRENEPAGQVFKNVQLLKTEPAGDFVRRMGGFARALGGRCTRCHVAGDWAADTRTEKATARGMIELVNTTNANLQKIQGVRSNTRIGCNTCHRGQGRPAP